MKMKKLLSVMLIVLLVTMSTATVLAKGAGSGSAGRGGGGSFAKPSGSTGKATNITPRAPQSKAISGTPSAPQSKPSSASPSAQQGKPNSSTTNNYYSSYGGHSSWGSGFLGGMMAGSLLHPTHVVAPAVYGGHGGVAMQAPMSFTIIYIVIDLLILSLIIYVSWKLYKRYHRRQYRNY